MSNEAQNLVEWFSERTEQGPLTPQELIQVKADSFIQFKAEEMQTIPKNFLETVLLSLPNLEHIDFSIADAFSIDLSFITYNHKWEKIKYIHLGSATCTDEDIRLLCAACPNLQKLYGLSGMHPLQEGDALNVTWLHSCPELLEVDLSDCSFLVDLRCFCHAPKLRVLKACRTNVYDLSSLKGCDLVELDVSGCKAVTNAEFVIRLPNLKVLRVADTGILSVDWVPNCASLEELDVSGCSYPENFSVIQHNKTLKKLVCRRGEKLTTIEISDTLEHLDLVDCFKIRDLSCLANKKALTVLKIGGNSIKSIAWVSSCVNLVELDVSGCYELYDLSPIGHLKKLRTLNAWCNSATDLNWIEQCESLETLNVQWGKNADLSPISRVKSLRKVRASGATECSWISACTQLEEVDFSGSGSLEDLSPLANLTNLKILHACGTGVKRLGWMKQCNQLEWIDLSWCPELISANEISYCKNLKTFRGFCSGIQELTYITRLTNIKRVEMYRCPLQKPTIQALQDLKARGVVLQMTFFAANTGELQRPKWN